MTAADRRLILRETTTDSDFFRFVGAEGYVLVHQAGPDEDMPLQYTYRSLDGRHTVRYLEEPIVHLPLILIWSEHPDVVEEAAQRHLDVVGRDEILAMYGRAETVADRRKALAFLALLASDGRDKRIVEVIDRSMRDPDLEVRLDAIWAMRYAPWPDVIPIAKRGEQEDPDRRVRKEARSFLQAYKKLVDNGIVPEGRR